MTVWKLGWWRSEGCWPESREIQADAIIAFPTFVENAFREQTWTALAQVSQTTTRLPKRRQFFGQTEFNRERSSLACGYAQNDGSRPDSSSPTQAAGRRHLPSLVLGVVSFGESGGVMCARKCKGKGRQGSGERAPSASRPV